MPGRPSLLLLPGTLCTEAVFEAVLPELGALAPHVVAVPFNRERSIDAMVDTALEHAGSLDPLAVVGFSMGGMVGLALAARAPERVARLALLNSNSHADLPGRLESRTRLIAAAKNTNFGSVVERDMLPGYLHLQRPGDRRLVVDMATQLGVEVLEAQSQALATRRDMTPRLGEISCPTLVLGSTHDVPCPPQVQVTMHQGIPGSDLVILGECGHFALIERPVSVARALVAWYLGDTARA